MDLAELVAPPGDTVSTADSKGSGEGFVGSPKNRSNSNADATVTAYIASGSLTTTGDISVLAKSETNDRANTTNSTGGFVGIGKSYATTDQTSTTHAYIAEGANIISGGDVTIDAWSNHITTGTATAKAGGFAADVKILHDVGTVLRHPGLPGHAGQDRGCRPCRDHFRRQRRCPDPFLCRWARFRRRRLCRITIMDILLNGSQSLVTLDEDAIVIADTAALRATTSNMDVYADAKGYGAGFVGVSDDYADMDIYALNKVLLDSGSSLTGYHGVDLEASFNNVDTFAYCYAKVAGLFGWLDSDANNNTTLTSSVVTESDALVTAGPRDNSYDYAFASILLGLTDLTELDPGDRLQMPDGSIYTYLGPTVSRPPEDNAAIWLAMQLVTKPHLWERDFLDHPTGDAEPLDQLALYVNTTNSQHQHRLPMPIIRSVRWPRADRIPMWTTTRPARSTGTPTCTSLSGEGAELVISDTGEIVKADGITCEDGSRPPGQRTRSLIPKPRSSSTTSETAAPARFISTTPRADRRDDTMQIRGSAAAAARGNFSDTLGQVLITNYWDKDLKINNINVVNTTGNPLVDLNSTTVTLTFDIDRTAAPTLVQILNEADSDIILNGTINNPIGSTVIHNSGGDIIAARARGVAEETATGRISLVRTAVLDIRATGSIGLGPVG